jgi:signal transduction histidine kinase
MARILVIEDEAPILENVVESLELEGYEAQGVLNGMLGVQAALENPPDLIICDITMPGMTGYEVLLQLRDHPRTTMVPFIFLTARADRDSMRQGMNIGADDYITKPFSIRDLLTAIQARLARKDVLAREYTARLEELRGTLIHVLPHELRTPLTTILGYAELISLEGAQMDRAQILKMVDTIYTSSQRLYHLTENFLLFAQIEVYIADPERRKKLCSQALSDPHELIVKTATAQAEQTRRTASLRFELEEVPSIAITQDNLRKIVEELVSNACHFSPADSPILIRGAARSPWYELAITDHGKGMSADQIARIDAYVQFERRLYEQQGAGLGLTIARRLAQLHGGQLQLESTPGQSTTVTVRLPLQPAH